MSQDPAAPPIQLTVTGGAGGQAANTADIATAADLVAAAAVHLEDARRRCDLLASATQAAYAQHFLDPSPMRDPTRGFHLRSAIDAVHLLDLTLASQVTQLNALDQRTRTAAQVLEAAEQSVLSTVWTSVRTVDGWDLTPASFWRTAALGALSPTGGSVRERFVAGFGAGIGKFNLGRNFLRPPQTSDAAELLYHGARGYGAWTVPMTTLHLPGAGPGKVQDLRPGHLTERQTTAAPVTSVTGAMTAIKKLPHETVEVQQVTHADGRVTWAVFVRGTDDLTIGSTSPFSAVNNLVLAHGERSDGMVLVESAMAQAGIPVGAAVGLYGHSQGGTVAASLAADPTFRRRYDLRSVATFGSPVATIVPATPVPMLSVQNQDEMVSSLAGAPPPDFPERVTIDADLPGAFGSGPTGASAHSLDTHAAVLDLAVDRDLPGVAAAVQQQGEVLGGPQPMVVGTGGPDAGRQVVGPPVEVVTTRFSPGPAPLPVPPTPVCLPRPPQTPELIPLTPPTTADGSLDWAEMTRRAVTARAIVGGG